MMFERLTALEELAFMKALMREMGLQTDDETVHEFAPPFHQRFQAFLDEHPEYTPGQVFREFRKLYLE